MAYATAVQLLEKCEALELAQAAVTDGAACRADVLAALINGTAVPGGTTPDELEIAQQAQATIEAELARASARIDSRLAVRYSLPFPSTPPELVPLCLDIARYFLHDKWAREEVLRRYTDAMAELEAIAKGLATITLPPGYVPVGVDSPALSDPYGRTFTRESMRNY